MTKKNGFTLIEVIVVTLIIATLALLVAPSFKNSTMTNEMEKAKMGLIELNMAAKLYREVNPGKANVITGLLNAETFGILTTHDDEEDYTYLQSKDRWALSPSGGGAYALIGMRCNYTIGDNSAETSASVICKFTDDEDHDQCNMFIISKANPAIIQKVEVTDEDCSTL